MDYRSISERWSNWARALPLFLVIFLSLPACDPPDDDDDAVDDDDAADDDDAVDDDDTADDDDAADDDDTAGMLLIQRVGEVHPLHLPADGRAVFADVILAGPERVFATYQLAPQDVFCEGKDLYFQELDRDLNPVGSEGATQVIDVSAVGSIYRPTAATPGDLGDHKFVFVDGKFVMLTTVPGEPEARLIQFDLDFQLLGDDSLFDDSTLARVGDENEHDRLLDMGFATDGTNLYAQFYDQPSDNPEDWSAQFYKLDSDLEVVDEELVQPEEGSFLTGTSLAWVPAGQMGASEDLLQNFSPNRDYGNAERSNIHTFATRASDLGLIEGSTRTITDADLDVYFPTGGAWNETHQLWVVGYTQEIAEGLHGHGVKDADACNPDAPHPPDEELREVGPSFISVYDAQWNEIDTIQLNDGEHAFRVMLDTQGDDIYVAYDEMDLYAWQDESIAKLEHYRITLGD